MRRPEHRAAEREYAPIGDDNADLRQEVDAEQPGDTKDDFAKPVSERRTDAAGEPKLMADSKKLREIAWRGEKERGRNHEPYESLRQRRKPEQQLRP